MKQLVAALTVAVWGACGSATAAAQSCPAPPARADCTAQAPSDGQAFAGPVLQVMEHGRVCVALGPSPSQWVPVEIADAPAGASRGAWMDALFAHRIECVSIGRTADGVRARCLSGGVSVAKLVVARPAPAPTLVATR